MSHRGSVKSTYSSNSSVILKVISGSRSNMSYSSIGSTYSKSSTILKKGGRRHAPRSRRGGDDRSMRSGRSNYQIIDGDSEVGDNDDVLSRHSTYINKLDMDEEQPNPAKKFNL